MWVPWISLQEGRKLLWGLSTLPRHLNEVSMIFIFKKKNQQQSALLMFKTLVCLERDRYTLIVKGNIDFGLQIIVSTPVFFLACQLHVLYPWMNYYDTQSKISFIYISELWALHASGVYSTMCVPVMCVLYTCSFWAVYIYWCTVCQVKYVYSMVTENCLLLGQIWSRCFHRHWLR